MKRLFYAACLAFAVSAFFSPAVFAESVKENERVQIDDNYSFKYVFPEKPKIGSSIVKINVFDKNGAKSDKLSIIGSYDMPQMRGRHSSGPVKFKLAKNGDYLMPLYSVMRGAWEIILIIYDEKGTELYTGRIDVSI